MLLLQKHVFFLRSNEGVRVSHSLVSNMMKLAIATAVAFAAELVTRHT